LRRHYEIIPIAHWLQRHGDWGRRPPLERDVFSNQRPSNLLRDSKGKSLFIMIKTLKFPDPPVAATTNLSSCTSSRAACRLGRPPQVAKRN
jgi:hypothetical protein